MFIKLFGLALPVFLIIDFIWLSQIAKNFYSRHLGFLMKQKPDLLSAGIFYLIFVSGIVYFVLLPSFENGSLVKIFLSGAFFGLVAYATYDLTNLATVKDWPIIVTLVDLIWGAFLSSVVSVVVYLLAKKIGL